MAPVPTPENIEIPGLRGERPIAGYDLGPAARGAQALARGVETLGTGITRSAEDIAGAVVAKRQNDIQNGLMNYSNAVLQNRVQNMDTNDPAQLDKWQADNRKLRDQFNASAPPPTTALGAHAHGRADRIDLEEDARIATRQREVSSSTAKADLDSDLERIGGTIASIYNPAAPHENDAALDEALIAHNDKIAAGVAHRDLTPLEGERYQKRAAQHVLDAQIHAVMIAAEKQPRTTEGNAERERLYGEAKAMIGRPLRQRGPMIGTGGTPAGAFSLVSKGETGDATVGPKALGNISLDSNGTHSYGPMGLNSGSGSLSAFVGRYGHQFGLTAPVGSAVFNAQWKAAASNRTDEFRAANEEWFTENHVGPTPGMLQQVGIPSAVANDPRVVSYFADRHIQQGALGIRNAAAAWNSSGGDVPRFLRNMTQDDAERVGQYFPSAIASGVYGARGASTRLNTRLHGALAAGDDEGVPASIPGTTPSYGQPGGPEHPAARVAMTVFSPEKMDILARKIEASRNASRIDEDNADRFEQRQRKRANDDAAGGWIKKMEDLAHTPGTDFVALAGQINNDDRLHWQTQEHLLDRVKKFSGEEQALAFGQGWRKAREDLFSDPGSPGHVNSVSDLIMRDDITMAGLADLERRASYVKKDASGREGSYARIENSFLKDAYKQFANYDPDNPFLKMKDPKGEHIYETQFVPAFMKQLQDLKEDARKTNDYSKVDQFLTEKSVSEYARRFRTPRQEERDRAAAMGEGNAAKGVPAGTVPAAPEGLNAAKWKSIISRVPLLSTGQPWPYQDWANTVNLFLSDHEPDADAEWNREYGRVITAQQLRDNLGITNAAALARQAEASGGTAAVIPAQPDAKATPPASPVAAPATAPAPTTPAFHGGRATAPTEAEIQAQEREVAERRAERERSVAQTQAGRFGHAAAGTAPLRGAEAIHEQERQRQARVQEQLSRLDRDEAAARENITSKRQLDRELKRIDAERASLRPAAPPETPAKKLVTEGSHPAAVIGRWARDNLTAKAAEDAIKELANTKLGAALLAGHPERIPKRAGNRYE